MTDNKMFNCSSCGPIEVAVVHGEWVGPEYVNVMFDITRPSFTDFNATINENSRHLLERTRIPKILADVEEYCENTRKFQCPTCGTTFGIPRPVQAPTPQTSGGVGASAANITNIANTFLNNAGLNPGAAYGIWAGNSTIRAALGNLSQSDIEDILAELGVDTSNFATSDEFLDELLNHII